MPGRKRGNILLFHYNNISLQPIRFPTEYRQGLLYTMLALLILAKFGEIKLLSH